MSGWVEWQCPPPPITHAHLPTTTLPCLTPLHCTPPSHLPRFLKLVTGNRSLVPQAHPLGRARFQGDAFFAHLVFSVAVLLVPKDI